MLRSTRLSLAALLLAIAPAVSAEPLPDIDAITEHLKFFGYEIVKKDDDRLECSHPQLVNFNVKALRGGTLFVTFFTTEPDAKKPERRKDVLELVNEYNQNSVLVNFFIDGDGDLGASAWFPGRYEKATFGALVDRWNADIREALQRDPERSRALIQ
jgi:hypothetical protein